MTKKTRRTMRTAIRMAALGLTGAALISTHAAAANRIFPLHLHNIDSQPVTFTIKTDGHDCYEGTPGLGEIFANVAPGEKVTITLARVQGHGCNGKQGRFAIEFTPGAGHRTVQYFEFDNAGHLGLTNAPNTYPGRLSGKARDESYTYTTWQRPKVTASKAIGSWRLVCQGYCNDTVSKEITNTTTRDKTQSSETTNAISVALEAGVEFPGAGSAKTTVTASQERRVGQSMSESIARGETNTKAKTVVYTPEQMRDLRIFAVWQWVATTRLSTGEQILVTSDKITCTQHGNPPRYLPGSPEDLVACIGGQPAAAAQPAPAARDEFAANLAGSRWTYVYGRGVFQFDFGKQTIDNFTNNYWQGVTWRRQGDNQVVLTSAAGNSQMVLTFSSPSSFTGMDWDGRTAVTGSRIGAAVAR